MGAYGLKSMLDGRVGHTGQVISLLRDGHDNSFLYVCACLSFSGDMGLMERIGFRIGDAM